MHGLLAIAINNSPKGTFINVTQPDFDNDNDNDNDLFSRDPYRGMREEKVGDCR